MKKNEYVFLCRSLKVKYMPPIVHLCSGWAIDGPMWQIYKQAMYKVIKWRKTKELKMKEYKIGLFM